MTESEATARFDAVLASRLSISRAEARRLLASAAVRLDGRLLFAQAKGDRFRVGAMVEIEGFAPETEQAIIPRPDLPLTVLAEGPGWAIIDKPAGQGVHPLRRDETDTVLNAAVARWPAIAGIGEAGLRSGVVHRLDLDTTGTLLLATTAASWTLLRDEFRHHRARKVYRAIVVGTIAKPARLEETLVIARHHPAHVKVIPPADPPPGARRCALRFRPVERLRGATLLEIELETGFLHQIRAMLAHLGHPVAGDKQYGENTPDPTAAVRQILHASYLKVGPAEAKSPDPADFAAVLAGLRTAPA